jgi:hypothetical protein
MMLRGALPSVETAGVKAETEPIETPPDAEFSRVELAARSRTENPQWSEMS